jgi:Fe-S-cluster-containing hydrogenase component 2
MKRKIITINKDLCDGCGNCVTACSEGALQIISGKASLVKEDFCDGFGDCIGECPTGALRIEEKTAKPFDIMATKEYLRRTKGREAVKKMEKAQEKHEKKGEETLPCGCPGSMVSILTPADAAVPGKSAPEEASSLQNWPVQIRLLPVKAPYYDGADLLIAADCCAYAYAGFHRDFIRGSTVAIGCPKLDNPDAHTEKIGAIIRENDIRSVTGAYMEVPCCKGLVRLAENAVHKAGKNIPVRKRMIGIKGQAL